MKNLEKETDKDDERNEKMILEKFVHSITDGQESMPGDFRKFVDDNFWDLV